MECDSVPSTIETAKKKNHNGVLLQVWLGNIILMSQFHSNLIMIYIGKYMSGNIVQTSNRLQQEKLLVGWKFVGFKYYVRTIQNPFINYSYNEATVLEIDVQAKSTRRKGWIVQLETWYNQKIPISTQKKTDLIQLCNKEIIPEEFHQYFEVLPVNKKLKDKIPVPSHDEESEETDKFIKGQMDHM